MKKKLVIDIGNTRIKAGVFEDKLIKSSWFSLVSDLSGFLGKIQEETPFQAGILSSVRDVPSEIEAITRSVPGFLMLHEGTHVPLKNAYETPQTLGKDRLAASCGAAALFPGSALLVINAGTCITYDLISAEGTYLGGSISPGLQMRLQALHTFTGRLPLLPLEPPPPLPGKNTRDSILTGAVRGALLEAEGMIAAYEESQHPLTVVISGGDGSFFENQLKSGIFVVPDLVLTGLNEILDFND